MVEFPFLGFLFDLLHCLFIDYGEVTQVLTKMSLPVLNLRVM